MHRGECDYWSIEKFGEKITELGRSYDPVLASALVTEHQELKYQVETFWETFMVIQHSLKWSHSQRDVMLDLLEEALKCMDNSQALSAVMARASVLVDQRKAQRKEDASRKEWSEKDAIKDREIFFRIAAEALGEEKVMARRDEIQKEMTAQLMRDKEANDKDS